VSDQLGLVFGALADSTRRQMLDTLLREGSTSVPALTADLPITRQAIAKHLSALAGAGLVEREPSRGREVRYRLRPDALEPAATWMREADTAWAGRLDRLRTSVESGRSGMSAP
jgi:DNA-binding transcriptional ArsR family regulator